MKLAEANGFVLRDTELAAVVGMAALLICKPVPAEDAARLRAWLLDDFARDPAATLVSVAGLRQALALLGQLRNVMQLAMGRDEALAALYGANQGEPQGLLAVVLRHVDVVRFDHNHRIALTRSDALGLLQVAAAAAARAGRPLARTQRLDAEFVDQLGIRFLLAPVADRRLMATGELLAWLHANAWHEMPASQTARLDDEVARVCQVAIDRTFHTPAPAEITPNDLRDAAASAFNAKLMNDIFDISTASHTSFMGGFG